MRTIFVTGTDTGVGKTTISIGLLTAWRARGYRVAALKPAETGCMARDAEALWPEDAARLREAAGDPRWPLELVCPHRYALPAAPAVAARHEQRPFDLAAVRRSRDAFLAERVDALLVEGAGGLLVPFAPGITTIEVAAALAPISVLIVARASLGTINHTALTVSELRRRDLPIAGIVLNRTNATPDPSEADNAEEIRLLTGVPVLGTLPHLEAPHGVDLGAALERILDAEALYRSLTPTRPAGA
jgi:dethiobiotin synthetase